MSLCRISPLASAIAALFLIPAAQADEASQDMEVIVVTASGYEQQLKDAPASISYLPENSWIAVSIAILPMPCWMFPVSWLPAAAIVVTLA